MPAHTNPNQPASDAKWFSTTHWSVVLRARDADTHCADEALEKLCHTYWPPIYTYIRRDGYKPEDAKDLTQEFLSRFVHKEWLTRLQHRDGKFRSFLLTFLKNFLSDQRDHDRALKRGGGTNIIPLPDLEAEEAGVADASALSAEQAYDRRWAQAVMDRSVEQLRQEYIKDGKAELYDLLKSVHADDAPLRYAEIGARLGLTEGAIKSAVHRMRKRHRDLLRAEISQTVSGEAEIEEEIRYLISVLRNRGV